MKFKKKIVLGTMKLKKYYNNSDDLAKFLNYVLKKGINQFHVSNEYESYKLFIKSLKKINTKKLLFVLKLSESQTHQTKFSLKKFEKKIKKYKKDLGINHNYIVQLVNRYKCNNPNEYLLYQQKTFDIIQRAVTILKKNKLIKGFYFFPYHIDTEKIIKNKFIDGITTYRNIKDSQKDNYAKKNKFKIIAIRVFGGNQIIIKKNLKKLLWYNLSNRLVEKVILGLNNKAQIDQFLKVC